MRELCLAEKKIITQLPAFVMGILNVTPDSFYKESSTQNVEQAVNVALKMIAQGADIIDIGAESSRPGSSYVSEQEELARLMPIVEAIRKETDCAISIDTRKKAVFESAFNAGADILNDISALEDDVDMGLYCAAVKCPVILMHKRGLPLNMQEMTMYTNLVEDIVLYLKKRKQYAVNCGIAEKKIIVDAGIGFAKDGTANIELIESSSIFEDALKSPVLVGLSRKSFLSFCDCSDNRLAGTIAANMLAVQKGASILRVHDVQETVDMLKFLNKTQCFIT